MKIKLFGAAKTVTGSCYSVETKKEKILVDCGMFQGSKKLEQLNYKIIPNPDSYSNLILTHAHLDHCGRIPLIVKNGFKGKVFATSATKDLAFVVMMDAAKIAAHDVAFENKKRRKQNLPPREPIYTEKDVQNAIRLFKTIEYNKKFSVTDNIAAVFHDAGHILGAGSVKLKIHEGNKETSIVFSGDIGQTNTPIVNDPEVFVESDYVFLESTYGDRLHPPIEERKNKFLRIIRETHKKGGKLLIPSFAIERAQELLYNINEFVEKNLMPRMPVYLDSPMAIKATEVFKKHPEDYDIEIKGLLDSGDDPFTFPGLQYSNTVQDSIKINQVDEPCIIIAGSGMCTAGRIKHHIKHNIDNPKNTILFVGYQAYGTLGYWIKKGQRYVRLLGKEKKVLAKVESIDAFSAHADYKGLLDWIKFYKPKPKKIFMTHGEEKSAVSLAKKVSNRGIETYIPDMDEVLTL